MVSAFFIRKGSISSKGQMEDYFSHWVMYDKASTQASLLKHWGH